MSDEDKLSNLDWFQLKITQAESRERLNWIAELINYCKWEEEDWTRDEESMEQLKAAWKAKAIELAK